jgi:hypothetical protein
MFSSPLIWSGFTCHVVSAPFYSARDSGILKAIPVLGVCITSSAHLKEYVK